MPSRDKRFRDDSAVNLRHPLRLPAVQIDRAEEAALHLSTPRHLRRADDVGGVADHNWRHVARRVDIRVAWDLGQGIFQSGLPSFSESSAIWPPSESVHGPV